MDELTFIYPFHREMLFVWPFLYLQVMLANLLLLTLAVGAAGYPWVRRKPWAETYANLLTFGLLFFVSTLEATARQVPFGDVGLPVLVLATVGYLCVRKKPWAGGYARLLGFAYLLFVAILQGVGALW